MKNYCTFSNKILKHYKPLNELIQNANYKIDLEISFGLATTKD